MRPPAQKPPVARARSIGTWQYVLELLVLIAIVTNFAFLVRACVRACDRAHVPLAPAGCADSALMHARTQGLYFRKQVSLRDWSVTVFNLKIVALNLDEVRACLLACLRACVRACVPFASARLPVLTYACPRCADRDGPEDHERHWHRARAAGALLDPQHDRP
jgi:hypothetical protein